MASDIKNIWTPAHQAVEDGEISTLARLLDSGVDPNEECCGMTLLAHAVDYEADVAVQGGAEMGVASIAVLLAYGASPLVRSHDGKSPLEWAQEYGHAQAERLLQRFTD
ncbi:ankyrin repeat domain-containing protein [Streptomyces hyaluromycini]|uniref:Ankyrin repeat domain-containing protein n=1 Tax=Streptomyces hyaluromycini TaxID=1377993 RepID=A0ABV1X0Z6_9ACTN